MPPEDPQGAPAPEQPTQPTTMAEYFASVPRLAAAPAEQPPAGDAAPEGGAPPEETPSPTPAGPDADTLSLQNLFLRERLAQHEAARAQQAEQARQQELRQLQTRWKQLDPAQAAREEAQHLFRAAQQREASYQAALRQRDEWIAQQQELAARQFAVDHLKAKFALKDDEVAAIKDFNDPYDMERAAAAFQARRGSQTQAARAAVAEARRASGVDRAASGAAGPAPDRAPKTMGEYFSSVPYQPADPRGLPRA